MVPSDNSWGEQRFIKEVSSVHTPALRNPCSYWGWQCGLWGTNVCADLEIGSQTSATSAREKRSHQCHVSLWTYPVYSAPHPGPKTLSALHGLNQLSPSTFQGPRAGTLPPSLPPGTSWYTHEWNHSYLFKKKERKENEATDSSAILQLLVLTHYWPHTLLNLEEKLQA